MNLIDYLLPRNSEKIHLAKLCMRHSVKELAPIWKLCCLSIIKNKVSLKCVHLIQLYTSATSSGLTIYKLIHWEALLQNILVNTYLNFQEQPQIKSLPSHAKFTKIWNKNTKLHKDTFIAWFRLISKYIRTKASQRKHKECIYKKDFKNCNKQNN